MEVPPLSELMYKSDITASMHVKWGACEASSSTGIIISIIPVILHSSHSQTTIKPNTYLFRN